MKFSKKNEIKLIAKHIDNLIDFRDFINHNPSFNGGNILRAGISDSSAGLISVNTLLAMWEDELWKEKDEFDIQWWIYQVFDDNYKLFSSKGDMMEKKGGRTYKMEYILFRLKIPCYGKVLNIKEIIEYVEKFKN